MPSSEDLYRELADQERAEDAQFRQNLAPRELGKFTPRTVDRTAAQQRYDRDFAPMYRRRELARTSRAYRMFLKATGQWRGMDAKDVEMVDPTKGLKLVGPTIEDVQREIAANPAKFKHLMKRAPEVHPVQAQRRGVEPRLAQEPKEDA